MESSDPENDEGGPVRRKHEILPLVIAIVVVAVALVVVATVTGKQVSNVFSNISNGLFAGSG